MYIRSFESKPIKLKNWMADEIWELMDERKNNTTGKYKKIEDSQNKYDKVKRKTSTNKTTRL